MEEQKFKNQLNPKTMKKSILSIAIILCAASALLTSCNKDEVDPMDQWGGSYELLMDGNLIAKGDTEEIGLFGNIATASNGEELGIMLANVPSSTGGIANIDDSDESGMVTINGRNLLQDDGSDEMFIALSGTIKRKSATTITFEGTCASIDDASEHTFRGTMESRAFKLIL